MEEWRVIPECEQYEVSSLGNIRRVGCPQLLSPFADRDGYLEFKPSINGKTRHLYIHRAVALAFIENPHNKPTVDHINKPKTDNRVENLRWATRAEQVLNRSGYSKSGLPKGVVKVGQRYKTRFRRTYLGTYDTPEEAHAAYVAAGTAYSPFFCAQ